MLTWKKEYSIHNDKIDEQHKNLFRVLNNLKTGCEEPVCISLIKESMKSLKIYAKEHIQDEESLMISSKYTYYSMHKKMHLGFEDVLKEIDLLIGKEDQYVVLDKMISTLQSWLLTHVTTTDRLFGIYMQDMKEK